MDLAILRKINRWEMVGRKECEEEEGSLEGVRLLVLGLGLWPTQKQSVLSTSASQCNGIETAVMRTNLPS